ncbi:NAD-dependent epimerase/dehydratase family protein [Siccirubricoccus sp. KC 17139]|uniref:NAD-dependent epimerase/dehydratase family protein n=1 Tax=Siccirubricoccus soli TaxID=2899147 RepID=A0ABT1D096_9PROT|nr:hopanoid-associated sugar epimerase [Siccirubricoccus soli]MCO6415326.1 NAD-dependent epimerase/dehydratase family protein [Siccirubricoccus soli]MCP2681458.1 NAD-dependent epimerase/dehydratase family protein [Siccirubricoccus soli]
MQETVMLTGATGFLGSAIALALRAEGHAVRALVRPGTPRDVLQGAGVEFIPGDLTDAASIAEAVRGCGAVIHCAADYRIFVPDPARMRAVNVGGTEAVMRAALAAGCRRVVHVSSVATLKPRQDTLPATEADAALPEEAIGPYKRSKTEAERLVLQLVAEAGLPAIIVNPSTPIGPRDRRPTPTGRVILEAARGRMPAYVDTGLNLVHVDDVARSCVAAMRRGEVGARHILGGQDVSLAELLGHIAALHGRRRPVRLPRAPLWPLALVSEAAALLTRREPMLTRDGLRMARTPMYFSSARAEQVLGHRARPWQEAVGEAIAWFRAAGMLA